MARRTIMLRGHYEVLTAKTSTAVRPGMFVEYNAGLFRPHNAAGEPAAPLVALADTENDGAGIDTNIASGASANAAIVSAGTVVNAVTADTIAQGEWVQSAGDGTVEPWNEGSDHAIGYAISDSDLSGTVGRVEIIYAPIGL
jgi:hypothetical protein